MPEPMPWTSPEYPLYTSVDRAPSEEDYPCSVIYRVNGDERERRRDVEEDGEYCVKFIEADNSPHQNICTVETHEFSLAAGQIHGQYKIYSSRGFLNEILTFNAGQLGGLRIVFINPDYLPDAENIFRYMYEEITILCSRNEHNSYQMDSLLNTIRVVDVAAWYDSEGCTIVHVNQSLQDPLPGWALPAADDELVINFTSPSPSRKDAFTVQWGNHVFWVLDGPKDALAKAFRRIQSSPHDNLPSMSINIVEDEYLQNAIPGQWRDLCRKNRIPKDHADNKISVNFSSHDVYFTSPISIQ